MSIFTNEYNATKSKLACYEDAFKARYLKIWGSTPCKIDANLKSFIRAHLIFMDDNIATENDRRNLLYEYMSSFVSKSDYDDLLNKSYNGLPVNNFLVNKVVNNTATSYVNAPSRIIGIESENLREQLTDILDEGNLNSIMDTLQKTALLTGECIVQPVVSIKDNDTKLSFNIHAKDNYSFNTRKDGTNELWIYGVREIDGKVIELFEVWTAETLQYIDTNNKNITQLIMNSKEKIMPNLYGYIPYLVLRLNGSTNNKTNTMYSLINSQLKSNGMEFAMQNNQNYNGFQILFGKNTELGKKGNKLGAGRLIEINNIKNDALLLEPELQSIDLSPQYIELYELKKSYDTDVLRSFNLPNHLIDQTANLQSGVAIELSRLPLIEQQKKNNDTLKQFDSNLINAVAVAYNNEVGFNYFPINFKVQIDYIDSAFTTPTNENYELYTSMFNAGILSAKQYLQSVASIDYIQTDEQAIEYINNNMQNLTLINKPSIEEPENPVDIE